MSILVEVQVHADIRRVNQPDDSVGYEGQTMEHDTPFEKIKIEAFGGASLVGQTYAAKWNYVPNENQEGTNRGWLKVTLSEEGTEVASFEARNTLILADDGSVRDSWVAGKAIPAADDPAIAGQFLLIGEGVCGELQRFTNAWRFESGDTREVTGHRCDEYSVIRITIR